MRVLIRANQNFIVAAAHIGCIFGDQHLPHPPGAHSTGLFHAQKQIFCTLTKIMYKILAQCFYLVYICTIIKNNFLSQSKFATMKTFFQSDVYTEFFVPETNEVWVFGDLIANITESTPHIFVDVDPSWGDGSEADAELPITDGHGTREWVMGKVYEGYPYELSGTTAERKISQFHLFNI